MKENKRINALIKSLKKGEGAIISSPENRFYVTGEKTSAGHVIITSEKAYFIIDFRYFNKIKSKIFGIEMILQDNLFLQINEIFKKHGIEQYYFETTKIPYSEIFQFKNKINVNISYEDYFDKKIGDLRVIKDCDEISNIKQAQAVTDKTFEYILNVIKPGKTEAEIALEMEFFGRKNGADGISFDFIVVSGAKSALPHGSPSEKVIENGDFLTMDFGFLVNGYCSDMTRTICIGNASEKQKEVYNLVLKAQLAALDAIKPEIVSGQYDKIARKIIEENGYGKYFGHGLGHGVGIDIHEAPNCGFTGTDILKPGMIITCEP
ncbi:MAG: aminopeptidase P family protein, partial [Oscillospiraceae bacterium]